MCWFATTRSASASSPVSVAVFCLQDAAVFLAAVEVLEKYPFCDRDVTTLCSELPEAYGANPQEQRLLAVLKMKVLLQTFAQGGLVKKAAYASR